jgi:hypothetical protein
MRLTREPELAAEWDLKLDQFRHLRRKHGWAHVKFSRHDIRYTAEQVEQIVRDMTVAGAARTVTDSGLTSKSARRAS